MFKRRKLQFQFQHEEENSFSSKNSKLKNALFCINNNLPVEPSETAYLPFDDFGTDDPDYITPENLIDLDDASEWRYELDTCIKKVKNKKLARKLERLRCDDITDQRFMLSYKDMREEVLECVEKDSNSQLVHEKKGEQKIKNNQQLVEIKFQKDTLYIEQKKEQKMNSIVEKLYKLTTFSSFIVWDVVSFYSQLLNNKTFYFLEKIFLNNLPFNTIFSTKSKIYPMLTIINKDYSFKKEFFKKKTKKTKKQKKKKNKKINKKKRKKGIREGNKKIKEKNKS